MKTAFKIFILLLAALAAAKKFNFISAQLIRIVILLQATKPTPVWWTLLLLTSSGVLAAELINTAVAKPVDHLQPDQHPTLKTVKDTLAGAVLERSVMALLVFAAFLWPRISI